MSDTDPDQAPAWATESSRVRQVYEAHDRDAGRNLSWTWSDRAYAAWMQALEWQMLLTLQRLGVDLRSSRVLDVGCGGGYFAARLLQFGALEVTGIDLVPSRVEHARSTYGGVKFLVADACAMPFEDNSFDLVTQFMCLSSVRDSRARATIGAEIARVSHPGSAVLSFDIVPRPALKRTATLFRSGPPAAAPAIEPVAVRELETLVGGSAVSVRRVAFPRELAAVVRSAGPFARVVAGAFPIRTHAVVGLRLC